MPSTIISDESGSPDKLFLFELMYLDKLSPTNFNGFIYSHNKISFIKFSLFERKEESKGPKVKFTVGPLDELGLDQITLTS
jgi:hypothetical protein